MAKDKISKTSHGFTRNLTDASQEVYQPCSSVACCLLMLKDTRWVAPGYFVRVYVVVGMEEAGVGEIVPTLT